MTFCEDTYYPMDDKSVSHSNLWTRKRKEVNFAFSYASPNGKQAGISVNGQLLQHVEGGRMAVDRIWRKGDRVELHLPMEVTADTCMKIR